MWVDFVVVAVYAQFSEAPVWKDLSLVGAFAAALAAMVTRTIVPGSAVAEQRKAFDVSLHEQKLAYDTSLMELKRSLDEARRQVDEIRREGEQIRKDRDMWANLTIQTVQASKALTDTMREINDEQIAIAKYLGKRLEEKP